MIDIPGSTALRFSLKQGNVFYFVDESFSDIPHLFVVLNKDHENDKEIYFVSFTSKIDIQRKRCKGHPEETLIEIDQADYKELSIKSTINCNDVKHRAKTDLVEMVDKHRVSFHKSPIPNDLLRKILAGVNASIVVEKKIKKLL